jgi:hypothetical protein
MGGCNSAPSQSSGHRAGLRFAAPPPPRALGYYGEEPTDHQHESFGHHIGVLRLRWKMGGRPPCAVPGTHTVRLRADHDGWEAWEAWEAWDTATDWIERLNVPS